MTISDRLPTFRRDGLTLESPGEWAGEKYLRVWMYDQMFSTGMKKLWDVRVYIDLFAGLGASELRSSRKAVPGSPLLALQVRDPFDKYIFCEESEQKMGVLRKRVAAVAPNADVTFVDGDVNRRIELVEAAIPRGPKVLSFCFVDPYSLRIKFNTLKRLATGRKVDFMSLLALQMDAQRNFERYFDEEGSNLDGFLGNRDWRERWEQAKKTKRPNLIQFLAEEYNRSMQGIGYLSTPIDSMHKVRTDIGKLPIYYLAFFSKHSRGYKFWDEVRKYSSDQGDLF